MPEPTPAAERLGGELKALRTMAGLSQRDVARAWNTNDDEQLRQPKVHRIERGEAVPTRAEFDIWISAANSDDVAVIEAKLLPLLEEAHNPARAWAGLLGEDRQLQTRAAEREAATRLTRNVSLSWIPGLLQTAEYARRLLAEVSPPGTNVAAQVAGRIERQRILYGDGRRFEFIVGEQALVWAPGPGVMAAQLDRIESLATLAAVDLAVLPLHRVGTVAWHDFIYREPTDPDEAPYVDGELMHAEFGTTDPDAVARYLEVWKLLWAAAATGDEARELIRTAGGGAWGRGVSAVDELPPPS